MNNLLKSAGSLDVTNLADGFAKFLVKRTKEELNMAFFDQFCKFITNDKYIDAQILFPQTYTTLLAIGDRIYSYEAYINILRESFEKDLDGLLTNLPKVIEDKSHEEFFNDHPDLKAICLSSLYVGNGLMNKVHPGKIIADYDVSKLDKIPDINIKASIQILKLFSESLRSKSTDHYWVPADSLAMLIKNDVAFNIYLGLIYQKSEGIKIQVGKDTTFQQVLAENASNFKQYDSYLRSFIAQASIVTDNIKNISGKESDKLTFTDYYNFYNSVLDLIQKTSTINQLPGLEGLNFPDDFNKYQNIARMGGNIALDINRRNYNSAVVNIFTLYNYALGGNNNEYGAQILKYGSFMATLVQAHNSDDVEAAIEAFALPSGSSRIKRETNYNFALNAYCGLFVGEEKIKGVNNWDWNSYGVAAPIGISMSKGNGSFVPILGALSAKHHWSHTLFLSAVDIGALAAFRFKDAETDAVPKIELKDIVSPGIFYSLGIAKTPLSINAGWQMGPLLREVTNTKNNYGSKYSRFSISVCVDIPILNFYSKPN